MIRNPARLSLKCRTLVCIVKCNDLCIKLCCVGGVLCSNMQLDPLWDGSIVSTLTTAVVLNLD